ncbi:phosphoglycolate phosphatase-like HAD superfamily hydrolase [Bradyrhizobium sp. i1.7.7]
MMKPVLVFDWNGTLLDDAYALLEKRPMPY